MADLTKAEHCEVCDRPGSTVEGRTFCEDCLDKLNRVYDAAMASDHDETRCQNADPSLWCSDCRAYGAEDHEESAR